MNTIKKRKLEAGYTRATQPNLACFACRHAEDLGQITYCPKIQCRVSWLGRCRHWEAK